MRIFPETLPSTRRKFSRSTRNAALGRFSLLFSALLIVVALQTSWVGDSLVVLDRADAGIKRGIDTAQWVFTAAGGIAGGLVALASGSSTGEALSFALLTTMWLLEEYGRRAFMARLDFLGLAKNDGTYLLVAASAIAAVKIWGTPTLTSIFLCMAAAAATAFVAGSLALPRHERLRWARSDRSDFVAVAKFGAWRSAQSGLGMVGGFIVRVVVVAMGSTNLLGELELGRLVVAPLFTLVAASSNALLPLFSQNRHDDARMAQLSRVTLVGIGSVTFAYGALVLSLTGTFVQLVGGSDARTGRLVIAGWLLQALIVGVTTPVFASALVRGSSSLVFWTKGAGVLVSTAGAWIAMLVVRPSLVPISLGVGLAVGAGLLIRFDSGSRRLASVQDSGSL